MEKIIDTDIIFWQKLKQHLMVKKSHFGLPIVKSHSALCETFEAI